MLTLNAPLKATKDGKPFNINSDRFELCIGSGEDPTLMVRIGGRMVQVPVRTINGLLSCEAIVGMSNRPSTTVKVIPFEGTGWEAFYIGTLNQTESFDVIKQLHQHFLSRS